MRLMLYALLVLLIVTAKQPVDGHAKDYTYRTVGQSFRIIDLMMAHGLLHGSDEMNLLHSIDTH